MRPLRRQAHARMRPAATLQQAQRAQRTVSLKGSQLYTRKPLVVPQAKQPVSWLKEMLSTSMPGGGGGGGGAAAARELLLCWPRAGGAPAS